MIFGGTGFMSGSNANIRLEVDDIEELKKHPFFSNYFIEIDAFLSELTGHV
jgi:hypothetical protein